MGDTQASPSGHTAQALTAVNAFEKAGFTENLYRPGTEAYEARMLAYYTRVSSELRPWAIIQPRTAEEVSLVVKTLLGIPGCQIAVRSGGHMSWPGANSIEDGIIVDLGLMNKTVYNADTKIASIEPGPRWINVYQDLEKDGVIVAGGREGGVGVAGLLLGGGISYYISRVGFACDQVVNYEVVLADGSIVSANEQSNPDLFRALKGGGSNFGIVTRFDMVTFPTRDVFDVIGWHPITETEAVIDAFCHLTHQIETAAHPDTHHMAFFMHAPATSPYPDGYFIQTTLTNLDGDEQDTSKAMEKFLAIPGKKDARKKSIPTKLKEFVVDDYKYDTWLSLSIKNDAVLLKKAVDVLLHELAAEIKNDHIPDGNFIIYTVVQPLLGRYAENSKARGGNMLGLEHMQTAEAILLLVMVQVDSWEVSQAISPRVKARIDQLQAYAESVDGAVEFLYGNYSFNTQEPLQTYGDENIRKMRAVSTKYDPDGVWQSRLPGGFKVGTLPKEEEEE